MPKMIIRNYCPFPGRAIHEPIKAAIRINRKAVHYTIYGTAYETGPESTDFVEGDALVCKNCGAIYVEARG